MCDIRSTKPIAGSVFRCDASGSIQEIIHDGLQFIISPVWKTHLKRIVDEGSLNKLARFLTSINDSKAAFEWELSCRIRDDLVGMRFAGVKFEDEILVLIAQNEQVLDQLIVEFARINNEQTNQLRSVLKENSRLQKEDNKISGLLDDISQLNNELVNTQRQLTKKNVELEQLHRQHTEELNHARVAQLAIFPREMPVRKDVKLARIYKPMGQIGGDFYDYYSEGRDNLGLLVGDATGHGIPAALLSFMFLTVFRSLRQKSKTLDEMTYQANAYFRGRLPSGKYATLFHGLYNCRTRVFTYISAGHPPAYLLRTETGELETLQTPGTVVGMFDKPAPLFKSSSVTLTPGDKLLIYTDGLLEVVNNDNQLLDTSSFEEYLITQKTFSIDVFLDHVYSFCSDYAGNKGVNDDATILGLEVL